MDLNEIIRRCIRILYISRKPSTDEFMKVAKVTALGIIVIGLTGLVISFILAPLG